MIDLMFAAALAVAPAPTADAGAETIRGLRLDYNQAIAARRPDAFARFLSPNFVEMDSSGGVTRGAAAVAQSYAGAEFKDPAFIAYDRQPDTVEISADGRRAVERGHWRARFRLPGGGETGAAGLYQAGWTRQGGAWSLQQESYVKLTCAGAAAC